MKRLRLLVLATSMVVVASPLVSGQDKGKDTKSKETTVQSKGQLPANWGKLGLTDEQKQKVYDVRAKYRGQIEDLQKKMQEIRDKERKEMEDVLNKDQKARLRELVASKAPAEGKPAETKGKDKDKDK